MRRRRRRRKQILDYCMEKR